MSTLDVPTDATTDTKPGNDNKRLKQLLRALSARHKTLKIKYSETQTELTAMKKLEQHTMHQEAIQNVTQQLEEARQQNERVLPAAEASATATIATTATPEEEARTSELASLVEEKTNALLIDELAAARESLSKQEISMKRVNERHKSLKALVKSQKKESEMKEKRITKQLVEKEEELESKTREATKLESDNASLTGTVESLREEMDSLRQQVEKHALAESKQEASMSRLRRVTKEREEVASRRMETITELEEKLSEVVGERDELRARIEVEEKVEKQDEKGKEQEKEQEEPVVVEVEVEVTKAEEEAGALEERGEEEELEKSVERLSEEEVTDDALVSDSQHEYLKQAVVRFLVTKEMSERVSLAPVIAVLLRLTPEESGRVVAAVENEASSGVLSGVTSWFSPYSD